MAGLLFQGKLGKTAHLKKTPKLGFFTRSELKEDTNITL